MASELLAALATAIATFLVYFAWKVASFLPVYLGRRSVATAPALEASEVPDPLEADFQALERAVQTRRATAAMAAAVDAALGPGADPADVAMVKAWTAAHPGVLRNIPQAIRAPARPLCRHEDARAMYVFGDPAPYMVCRCGATLR
jgi:hypothetical protein